MATFNFDEVGVYDLLPGGTLRTIRGGNVRFRRYDTDAVVATVPVGSNGRVSYASDTYGALVLETDNGFRRPVFSTEALMAAASFGTSEDSAVASLLNNSGSASRAAISGLFTGKGSIGYAAADYGVTADGSVDDRLRMLDVLNAGQVVVLPKGGTIRVGAKLVLPAGRTIVTNGAKFVVTGSLNDYAVQVTSGTTILGGLVVETPAGADVRGVEVVGSDITIDRLVVTAASAGAGAGDINDCGLSVRNSARVAIGQTNVTNYDYAAKVTDSSDVDLGKVRIQTYVRGVYVSNVAGLNASGRIFGASPNAAVTPGHNGVLIDATSNGATTDVDLRNLAVSDAGEHGFRIGGSFTVKRVRHIGCSAVNVGGCGFKVLGDATNKHEDLAFTDCVVEDAAQSGTNGAGFMLQYVRRVKVNGGIVRKNLKTFSASEGFNIQGAESVSVNDPDLSDTAERAYAVLPNLGNNTAVRLTGGRMSFTSGVGVKFDYTGAQFRRVAVEGWPQIEPGTGTFAVSVTNTGGTGSVIGNASLTWQSVSAADRQVDPASNVSAYLADVRAAFTSGPIFKAGSRWYDGSVLRVSNGTAWAVSAAALRAKGFGATGDGTTVDTTAVQAALDAAAAGDVKTVLLELGTFVVSNLTIPAGVTLDGAGGVLKQRAATASPAVTIPTTSPGAVLRNVEIDGNTANQTNNVNGVEVKGDRARVEGCYVHDVKLDGISVIAPADGVVVSGNRVKTTGRYGITLNSGDGVTPVTHCVVHGNSVEGSNNGALGIIGIGSYVTFSSNTTKGSGGDGIAAYNKQNRHVTCTGNTIESPGNHGIHLGGDGLVMSGNAISNVLNGHGLFVSNNQAASMADALTSASITGNTIRGVNPGAGVRVEFARGVAVSGNSIDTAFAQGVFLKDCDDVTVGSNTIRNTGASGTAHGIQLLRARGVAITGNALAAITGRGIYGSDGSVPADACVRVVITGNTINGTSSAGIQSLENSNRWLVDANIIQAFTGSAVVLIGANNVSGTNLTT